MVPVKLLTLLLPVLLPTMMVGCTVIQYPRRWAEAPAIPRITAETAPAPAAPLPEPPAKTTSKPVAKAPPRVIPPSSDEIEGLLETGRNWVGTRGPLVVEDRRFPFDCSGFVCALYYQMGIDLFEFGEAPDDDETGSGTEIIYRRLSRSGQVFSKDPLPGDLVFFDNTWDRDGDGQFNDTFTHIAVVERIRPSGTVEMLHLGSTGIGRIHLNIERSSEYRDEKTGEILNHKLRRKASGDTDQTPSLTGQLFRAFGRP